MQLMLTDQEARTLTDVLQAYLPGLRRETADCDLASRQMRRELTRREELCERLLADLARAAAPPPPPEGA